MVDGGNEGWCLDLHLPFVRAQDYLRLLIAGDWELRGVPARETRESTYLFHLR